MLTKKQVLYSSRSRCNQVTEFPTLSNPSACETPTLLYTWSL